MRTCPHRALRDGQIPPNPGRQHRSARAATAATAAVTSQLATPGRDRCPLADPELAQLATDIGVAITVCHYPPGTSKWNKIETSAVLCYHQQLARATADQPRGHIELIGATTTRTGLTVHAEADNSSYPRGIKISDAQMLAIKPQFKPDKFHGEWNYLVKPATPAPTPASN